MYHHYIPHVVVETPFHIIADSLFILTNAPRNWNLMFEKKKKSCQFIIMLDEKKMQLVNVEQSLSVYQVSTCFVFTDKSYG